MNQHITSQDIARLAGVRATTVRQWRARFGDFPAPVANYGGTLVYERCTVEAWLRNRGRLA
jgi:hypothetical protein